MGSLTEQLHFILFPFMAPGHMNPMVDIGMLLAQHGVIITIVTSPHNAVRFEKILTRAKESGLPIHVVKLPVPCIEVGLPEGSENMDMLSSVDMYLKFFKATNMLQEPVQKLLAELTPRPSCLISDACLYYTTKIASQLQIPRISFHGFGSFCLVCLRKINSSKVLEAINSDSDYFTVPGLPDKVEFRKAQVPAPSQEEEWKKIHEEIKEADLSSYGVVVNTFEELEPAYVEEYKKIRGGKVWCIGPVSLRHRDAIDKAQRGGKASIDEHQCLKWLDSQEPCSVIYCCLGTICSPPPLELKELGLGLEASNRPFIWVIRGNEKLKEVEKWILEDGFEERTKGRGLVIRGWAPQVLILSHPAIGGFLTHCGWNSTLEGICSGVPLITWPLFADQFCNEKLVMQILQVGVRIGVEFPTRLWEQEKVGVMVRNEDVKNAVEKVMDDGDEGKERRKRAKKLRVIAKKAVEEGGSSQLNLTKFIQDIMQLTHGRRQHQT